MPAPPEDGDDEFRAWFREPAALHGAMVRNMRRLTTELRAAPKDPGDQRDRTASVIYLLGADTAGAVPEDVFAEFATVVVQAVADQGAGTGFHRRDLAVQAIESAVGRVRAAGHPATALLLAEAGYLGCIANDCPERLATLRSAVREATGEDRLRAQHALVTYLIEVSRYRRAIRLCDEAMAGAAAMGASGEPWRAAFLASRGIARYTTLNDPDAARADLLAAARTLDGCPGEHFADCRSSALHYLGRCLLDEGDVAGSLAHYLAAQRIRESLPFQSGSIAYFHIRMAETLLGAGAHGDAGDHLGEARRFLDRIGDSGSTTVCYQYALANAHALRGETDEAVAELTDCAARARSCRFARGRLLVLTRLFSLHLQRRAPLSAVAALLRGVPLLVDGELRRNSLVAIMGRLKRYARHVSHPYGAATAAAPGGPVLRCPCSLHRRAEEAPDRAVACSDAAGRPGQDSGSTSRISPAIARARGSSSAYSAR